MSEPTTQPLESLASSVEKMIRQIAQPLPEGVATLEVKRGSSCNPPVGFALTPNRPSAARIHIDVDEQARIAFLAIGRGAVYEIPSDGRRYSDLSQLDELRALCLAAVRGEFRETVSLKGHEVVGVDVSSVKVEIINNGQSPIVESGIGELIGEMVAEGRLRATTASAEAIRDTEISLVCVGTPSNPNGSLDLTYIKRVCKEIGAALEAKSERHTVVMRSTMLPHRRPQWVHFSCRTDASPRHP